MIQDSSIVDELRRCVGFSDDDVRTLSSLRPVLEPHFEAIADELGRIAIASGAVASTVQLAQLRGALIAWMTAGLAGPRGCDCAIATGYRPQWIVAVMSALRDAYVARIVVELPRDRIIDAIRAVNKLLDIELVLMLRSSQLESERRLALRERNSAIEQLAAMTTLSSGLAHEMRNPLNSAKLQLELVRRRLHRTSALEGLAEPTELAYHELARLTAMVNDFLAFAKPSPLQTSDQDLITIVHQVVELERPLAERRRIALAIESAHPTLQARIDADKLQQAIQNLVRNALEAVPIGGHVTVRVGDDAEHIHILVVDDGPGIPAEVRARMYEPFFSTKESGTGLGMSIARTLIAMQAGTIEVATSGSGTTFDVALPRAV
jgi:signal transduction histidine kinase